MIHLDFDYVLEYTIKNIQKNGIKNTCKIDRKRIAQE